MHSVTDQSNKIPQKKGIWRIILRTQSSWGATILVDFLYHHFKVILYIEEEKKSNFAEFFFFFFFTLLLSILSCWGGSEMQKAVGVWPSPHR